MISSSVAIQGFFPLTLFGEINKMYNSVKLKAIELLVRDACTMT